MSKKIILLNGPPECGKDTLANLVKKKKGQRWEIEKLSRTIRNAALATFPYLTEDSFDYFKNLDLGNGKTLRDWMINFSEDLMKPMFGKSIFGTLCADRIERSSANFFLVDCGFSEEAEILVDRFGASNVFLIHIYKEGTSFKGDSRERIHLPGILSASLTNINGDPECASNVMIDLIERFNL